MEPYEDSLLARAEQELDIDPSMENERHLASQYEAYLEEARYAAEQEALENEQYAQYMDDMASAEADSQGY